MKSYSRTFVLFATFTVLFSTPAMAKQPQTPQDVVQAYCTQDAQGHFLQSSGWEKLQQLTTWPDTPGWDTVVVIRDVKVIDAHQAAKIANVTVDYAVLGTMSVTQASGLAFNKSESIQKVTFKLVRQKHHWKISEPQEPPHITIESALAQIRAANPHDTETKRSLRALSHAQKLQSK